MPKRFCSIALVRMTDPVTLLPGRLKLWTRPALTGSLPVLNTTGMVVVASFAARAEELAGPPAL